MGGPPSCCTSFPSAQGASCRARTRLSTFLTMLMIYVVHVLRKRRMWKAALITGRVMFALYLVSVAWIVWRVWVAVQA